MLVTLWCGDNGAEMEDKDLINNLDNAWREISRLAKVQGFRLPQHHWAQLLSDTTKQNYWQIALLVLCCQWQQEIRCMLQKQQQLMLIKRQQAVLGAMMLPLPSVGLVACDVLPWQVAWREQQDIQNLERQQVDVTVRDHKSADTSRWPRLVTAGNQLCFPAADQDVSLHQRGDQARHAQATLNLIVTRDTELLPLKMLAVRVEQLSTTGGGQKKLALLFDLVCLDKVWLNELANGTLVDCKIQLQFLDAGHLSWEYMRLLTQHVDKIEISSSWAASLVKLLNLECTDDDELLIRDYKYTIESQEFCFPLGDQSNITFPALWQQPQHGDPSQSMRQSIYEQVRLLKGFPAVFAACQCDIIAPFSWQEFVIANRLRPDLKWLWGHWCNSTYQQPALRELMLDACPWTLKIIFSPDPVHVPLIEDLASQASVRYQAQVDASKRNVIAPNWLDPAACLVQESTEVVNIKGQAQQQGTIVEQCIGKHISLHSSYNRCDQFSDTFDSASHIFQEQRPLINMAEDRSLATGGANNLSAVYADKLEPEEQQGLQNDLEYKRSVKHYTQPSLIGEKKNPTRNFDNSWVAIDLQYCLRKPAPEIVLQAIPVIDLQAEELKTPPAAQELYELPVFISSILDGLTVVQSASRSFEVDNLQKLKGGVNKGHINCCEKSIYLIQQASLQVEDQPQLERLQRSPSQYQARFTMNYGARVGGGELNNNCHEGDKKNTFSSYMLTNNQINILPDSTQRVLRSYPQQACVCLLNVEFKASRVEKYVSGWRVVLRGLTYHTEGITGLWRILSKGFFTGHINKDIFHNQRKLGFKNNIMHKKQPYLNSTFPGVGADVDSHAVQGPSVSNLYLLARPSMPVGSRYVAGLEPPLQLSIAGATANIDSAAACVTAWSYYLQELVDYHCFNGAMKGLALDHIDTSFKLVKGCIYKHIYIRFKVKESYLSGSSSNSSCGINDVYATIYCFLCIMINLFDIPFSYEVDIFSGVVDSFSSYDNLMWRFVT